MNPKKELWQYIKESGGKCKQCWFEEGGKCLKYHSFTDENVPQAKELCKNYENAYAKMWGFGQKLNQ